MAQEWEALPQRKKTRRDMEGGSTHHSIVSSTSAAPRTIPKTLDLINEAVSARANANRAVATLESGDGCDGENFECCFFFIIILMKIFRS
jgi:hypothetical protein